MALTFISYDEIFQHHLGKIIYFKMFNPSFNVSAWTCLKVALTGTRAVIIHGKLIQFSVIFP